MMRVGIIGIGALGTLFGARLARHASVVLTGHQPTLLQALQGGITYIDSEGEQAQLTVEVIAGTAPLLPLCDLVLVLVKAYQTPAAATLAKRMLNVANPEARVLTLQNGMGNWEVLSEALGSHRVAAGVTTQAALLEAPARVKDTGKGIIWLPTPPVGDEQAMEEIRNLFERAAFEVRYAPSMRQLQWEKLLINAVINPLTAIYRQPNGFITHHKEAREIAIALIREFVNLAAAAGLAFEEEQAYQQVWEVARRTASNQSSMLRDVQNSRPTEIEAILGYLIGQAEKHQLGHKTMRQLYEQVKAIAVAN